MPRRGSSKPPAEPVVKPYGCDFKVPFDDNMSESNLVICQEENEKDFREKG